MTVDGHSGFEGARTDEDGAIWERTVYVGDRTYLVMTTRDPGTDDTSIRQFLDSFRIV